MPGALLLFRKAADYLRPRGPRPGRAGVRLHRRLRDAPQPPRGGPRRPADRAAQPAVRRRRRASSSRRSSAPRGACRPPPARSMPSCSPARRAQRRPPGRLGSCPGRDVENARLADVTRVFDELAKTDPEDAAAAYNLGPGPGLAGGQHGRPGSLGPLRRAGAPTRTAPPRPGPWPRCCAALTAWTGYPTITSIRSPTRSATRGPSRRCWRTGGRARRLLPAPHRRAGEHLQRPGPGCLAASDGHPGPARDGAAGRLPAHRRGACAAVGAGAAIVSSGCGPSSSRRPAPACRRGTSASAGRRSATW